MGFDYATIVNSTNKVVVEKPPHYPETGIVYQSETSFTDKAQFSFKQDPKFFVKIEKEIFEVLTVRCNGVKSCSDCEQVYPLSARKQVCKIHKNKLTKVGCEVKFFQLKKQNQSLFLFYGQGEHSHQLPPPTKVDREEEQAIVLTFQQNPTLTPKQALLGVGTNDLPYLKNPALLNVSKYQQLKRKALENMSMDNPNPISTLFKVARNPETP